MFTSILHVYQAPRRMSTGKPSPVQASPVQASPVQATPKMTTAEKNFPDGKLNL